LLILDSSSWKVAIFRFADDKLSLCIAFQENHRWTQVWLVRFRFFYCFDLFSTDFEFEEQKENLKENEDCKSETKTESESALSGSVGRFRQTDEEKLCFYGKTARHRKQKRIPNGDWKSFKVSSKQALLINDLLFWVFKPMN